jgi:Skp family chaperone for outer membrane proteins
MSMNSPRSRFTMTIALAAALLAGGGVSTLARPEPAPVMAAPTVVAVVDLERLMNGLVELSTKQSELETRRKSLQDQLNDIRRQIDAVENELKINVPETEIKARTEKLAQKFELEALYEARGKAFQRLIDLENGDVIRDLYLKVRESVANFAAKNQIDLVMLDDRSIKFPSRASVKEVNGIIESKRVLFSNDVVDITDRLLGIMNNEYKAGVNVGTNGRP